MGAPQLLTYAGEKSTCSRPFCDKMTSIERHDQRTVPRGLPPVFKREHFIAIWESIFKASEAWRPIAIAGEVGNQISTSRYFSLMTLYPITDGAVEIPERPHNRRRHHQLYGHMGYVKFIYLWNDFVIRVNNANQRSCPFLLVKPASQKRPLTLFIPDFMRRSLRNFLHIIMNSSFSCFFWPQPNSSTIVTLAIS